MHPNLAGPLVDSGIEHGAQLFLHEFLVLMGCYDQRVLLDGGKIALRRGCPESAELSTDAALGMADHVLTALTIFSSATHFDAAAHFTACQGVTPDFDEAEALTSEVLRVHPSRCRVPIATHALVQRPRHRGQIACDAQPSCISQQVCAAGPKARFAQTAQRFGLRACLACLKRRGTPLLRFFEVLGVCRGERIDVTPVDIGNRGRIERFTLAARHNQVGESAGLVGTELVVIDHAHKVFQGSDIDGSMALSAGCDYSRFTWCSISWPRTSCLRLDDFYPPLEALEQVAQDALDAAGLLHAGAELEQPWARLPSTGVLRFVAVKPIQRRTACPIGMPGFRNVYRC